MRQALQSVYLPICVEESPITSSVIGCSESKWFQQFLRRVAGFGQRMEALALLVKSSELSLQGILSDKTDGDALFKQSGTQITLQLSFYDLVAESADRSKAEDSNEESA